MLYFNENRVIYPIYDLNSVETGKRVIKEVNQDRKKRKKYLPNPWSWQNVNNIHTACNCRYM